LLLRRHAGAPNTGKVGFYDCPYIKKFGARVKLPVPLL
jgi:hypothetical protein